MKVNFMDEVMNKKQQQNNLGTVAGIVAMSLALNSADPAYADLNLENGNRIFEANCVACH